jgi:hypothetical protein
VCQGYEIDKYTGESNAGDYDNLLRVAIMGNSSLMFAIMFAVFILATIFMLNQIIKH